MKSQEVQEDEDHGNYDSQWNQYLLREKKIHNNQQQKTYIKILKGLTEYVFHLPTYYLPCALVIVYRYLSLSKVQSISQSTASEVVP